MNNLAIVGKPVTMTSLELVDYINGQRAEGDAELRHDNFMAKVPKVLGDQSPKFLGDYTDIRGRTYPCYRFPKREACLMAMSYSYELQAKVFDHMTALEARLVQQPKPLKDSKAIDALRLARAAEINMKTAERIFAHLPNLGGSAKQSVLAHMINPVVGAEVIALPHVTEHLFLAGEVGAMLGVSANMVGRIANANNLKTEHYGEYRLNKAAGHDRQVESFYYNARGVDAVRDALSGRGEVA
jgi:hypothetical protein